MISANTGAMLYLLSYEGSNPTESLIFLAASFQLLKVENLLR